MRLRLLSYIAIAVACLAVMMLVTGGRDGNQPNALAWVVGSLAVAFETLCQVLFARAILSRGTAVHTRLLGGAAWLVLGALYVRHAPGLILAAGLWIGLMAALFLRGQGLAKLEDAIADAIQPNG